MTTRPTRPQEEAEFNAGIKRLTDEGKTREVKQWTEPTPPVAKQDFDPAKPLSVSFKDPKRQAAMEARAAKAEQPEAPTSAVWKDPKRQKASEASAAAAKKEYGPKKNYSKSYKAIGARARSDAQAKEASGGSGQEGPDDIDIANERIFKALAARRNA